MPRLDLKIDKSSGSTRTKTRGLTVMIGGQTVTLFRKRRDNDPIVFHNEDGSDLLSVVFDPAGAPLANITVGPGQTGNVSVAGAVGDFAKYTAKIGTAPAEDPIIILD